MTESQRFPIDLLDAALRADSGCVAPERIAAAVAGELSESERRAVLAHAEGCSACGAEVALAQDYFESSVDAAEIEAVLERLPENPYASRPLAEVVPFRARRRPLLRPAAWAAAASVLLAVALGWVTLRDRGPGTLPDRPIEDVVRGGRIEITTPLGALPEAPASIAWSPIERATTYRIEILGVDGEPVASAETAAPVWQLPAEARGALQTLVAYRVRVSALDAGGAELAASSLEDLRLDPAR